MNGKQNMWGLEDTLNGDRIYRPMSKSFSLDVIAGKFLGLHNLTTVLIGFWLSNIVLFFLNAVYM